MTGSVLFMCTANQCRSPMAEALGRAAFAEHDLAISTSSAGEMAGGQPATDDAVAVMARRGLDLSGHASRRIDPQILGSAGLILTMERRHLIAIAAVDIDAVSRAFPFRELVANAPQRDQGESLGAWVGRAHDARDRSRILVVDTTSDVADPMGGGPRRFRRCADTLAGLTDRLAALLSSDGGHGQMSGTEPSA